jgi:hypothetical protein
MYFNMVRPRGIEPLSTVLQTVAMTTSAKDANDTLLITLYAECHGDIEFVSSSASLIRNHFALYTLGLEVRSNS